LGIFAEKDVIAASTLIDNAELTGEVAFHCQQAIEKYFKAYLVENDKQVRKIHDLLKLYSEIKNIKGWNIDEILLEDIGKIYTESRYPDDIGIKPDGLLPTQEEAQKYLDFTKKIENIFKDLIK
jgi:HEPN domain-containing protein